MRNAALKSRHVAHIADACIGRHECSLIRRSKASFGSTVDATAQSLDCWDLWQRSTYQFDAIVDDIVPSTAIKCIDSFDGMDAWMRDASVDATVLQWWMQICAPCGNQLVGSML